MVSYIYKWREYNTVLSCFGVVHKMAELSRHFIFCENDYFDDDLTLLMIVNIGGGNVGHIKVMEVQFSDIRFMPGA